jgi:hypothetical protein
VALVAPAVETQKAGFAGCTARSRELNIMQAHCAISPGCKFVSNFVSFLTINPN